MNTYILSIDINGQTLFLTKDFGYESVPHNAQVFTSIEDAKLFIDGCRLTNKRPRIYLLPTCEEVNA